MKKDTNFLKNHLFIAYWMGAALALTAGMLLVFDHESHVVTYFIIGVFLVILGIGRLITLVKTTKTWVMRIINAVLLLLDAGLGVFFIWKMNEIQTSYAVLSAYLCGGVLFLNGFCTLFGSSIKNEVTTIHVFLLSTLYLGVGGYIIGSGSMNLTALNYVILGFALIVFVILTVLGIQNYRDYRYALKGQEEKEPADVPAANITSEPQETENSTVPTDTTNNGNNNSMTA